MKYNLNTAARKVAGLSLAASAFVASAAMAADDAATQAAAGISGSSTGILSVQNAVIGIVILGVVFAFIKGAIKK